MANAKAIKPKRRYQRAGDAWKHNIVLIGDFEHCPGLDELILAWAHEQGLKGAMEHEQQQRSMGSVVVRGDEAQGDAGEPAAAGADRGGAGQAAMH
jgi:hypothetical protein